MFREDKAISAIGLLLSLAPNQELNDLVLMKLLYFAERRTIAETTHSITGSRFVSMRYGPVLSEVLNGTKDPELYNEWPSYIEYHGAEDGQSNTIKLRKPVPYEDHLSKYEIRLLNEEWELHGSEDKWDVVDHAHSFPEWNEEAERKRTSIDLSVFDILKKGFGETADVALRRARDYDYYNGLAD